MSLFQSNLRKQIRNLPKILNFVKKIHYYSELFTSLLKDETTFLEILTRFKRAEPPATPTARVHVRNRIAQYLSLPGLPQGVFPPEGRAGQKLAVLANGQAVSFFDYDWELERANARLLGSGRRI